MRTTTDNELLEAWVTRRSDPAFTELVSRYVDLVYSAALRQLGDSASAEDVAQAVFLVLARKAASLRRPAGLAGWLHRTTRYMAIGAIRSEARRHRREQEAATMTSTIHTFGSEDPKWAQVAPLLDEALAALRESDRNAVLLRFFQAKPMEAVGEQLGVSEEAAKKRVSRALDKLRRFLLRRGVALSAATLAAYLAHNSVQAAPASLVAKIIAAQASAALSSGVAALVAATLRQMLWFKVRQAFGWGAVAVATLLLLKTLALPSGRAPQAAALPVGPPTTAPVAETAPARKGSGTRSTAAKQSGKVFFLHIRAAADNQPVPDAGVTLDCWGQRGAVFQAKYRSSTNGICEMPVPAVAFDTFRVWVSADGFVPKVMDWKLHELEDPVTSHTTRLDRGLTLAGVVQDEQGTPVAGAKIGFTGPGIISTERENVALYSRASVIRSDASGHFVSRQMPSHADTRVGVVVSHPDFAAQWLHAALPDSLRTNWVIVLTHGLPLPGRVISAQGAPVSRATVLVREPHGGADVSAKTDAEGNFAFAHIPSGPAQLEVSVAGFQRLEKRVLVESNADPVLLELEPAPPSLTPSPRRNPVRLSGTVVDANSGTAIPRFEVVLNERRGTAAQLLGEGHDGAFDWKTPLTFASWITLEVDADGYEPQVSSVRKLDDGDQAFEFRLRPGGVFTGQVLQPDGQPAVDVALGIDTDGRGLRFQPPAKLLTFGFQRSPSRTDTRGAFSFKTVVGATAILAVHETGCAAVPILGATNLMIQLEAWGSIEGTVYIGSAPAAGQTVEVGFQSIGYAADQPRLWFDLTTQSDSEGRFRFARVPPGNHTVFRYINLHEGKPGPIGFSHGERVPVRPGETAQVTLGGKGRPIIGRFLLSHPLTNYNWRDNLVPLVQDKSGLVPPQVAQFLGSPAYYRAWDAYDAAIRKYFLECQPDGTFRVEDVLPGKYTLTVRVGTPTANSPSDFAWTPFRQLLGGITNTVIVPPIAGDRSDDPLDLGAIAVPIVDAPAPGNGSITPH